MTKTKKRFNRMVQPMKVDLTKVDDSELFTELMNRVTRMHPTSCYFIDSTSAGYSDGKWRWNIHAAGSKVLIKEN